MQNFEDRLIRLPEVLKLCGIKKSTVWAWIAENKMPRPRKLSTRVAVWSFSEMLKFVKGEWVPPG